MNHMGDTKLCNLNVKIIKFATIQTDDISNSNDYRLFHTKNHGTGPAHLQCLSLHNGGE